MQKTALHYDREHDILYIVIHEGEEDHFVEVVEGVIVEFDQDNQTIGIEFFNASKTFAQVMGANHWLWQYAKVYRPQQCYSNLLVWQQCRLAHDTASKQDKPCSD
jgi:uncharacterized protein YuzE